jgi:hypothetical protein
MFGGTISPRWGWETRVVAGTIPIKTPLGQAELSARKRSVSQRHRTVLFLVDGRRGAAEVISMALQAGVPANCFDELLAQGLIMLPEPMPAFAVDVPQAPTPAIHVDLPLPGPEPVPAAPDSLLPPSRTLQPESVSGESVLVEEPLPDSWFPSETGGLATLDPALHEARLVMLRAVRAEAPLAGSLTLMRLRRARTRAEIVALLDEVEARISKPHRALAAAQTMRRVRELLDGRRIDSTLESA